MSVRKKIKSLMFGLSLFAGQLMVPLYAQAVQEVVFDEKQTMQSPQKNKSERGVVALIQKQTTGALRAIKQLSDRIKIGQYKKRIFQFIGFPALIVLLARLAPSFARYLKEQQVRDSNANVDEDEELHVSGSGARVFSALAEEQMALVEQGNPGACEIFENELLGEIEEDRLLAQAQLRKVGLERDIINVRQACVSRCLNSEVDCEMMLHTLAELEVALKEIDACISEIMLDRNTKAVHFNLYLELLQNGKIEAGFDINDLCYEAQRMFVYVVASTYQEAMIRKLDELMPSVCEVVEAAYAQEAQEDRELRLKKRRKAVIESELDFRQAFLDQMVVDDAIQQKKLDLEKQLVEIDGSVRLIENARQAKQEHFDEFIREKQKEKANGELAIDIDLFCYDVQRMMHCIALQQEECAAQEKRQELFSFLNRVSNENGWEK